MKYFSRSLLASALVLGLSGCVTAAVTTAATGAAGVATDPRSTSTMYDDKVINHDVETKVKDTKGMKNNVKVTATSYDGQVLLTGQAKTSELSEQVAQIASTVPGVKSVVNELQIGDLSGFSTYSDDTWITTKVRTKLTTTQGFSSGDFKVVTENGVVYVMGRGSEEQGELATKAISQIDGVKKVVTLFQPTSE